MYEDIIDTRDRLQKHKNELRLKEYLDQLLQNPEQEDPRSTYHEARMFRGAMSDLFGVGPKTIYNEALEHSGFGVSQWLIILTYTFTIEFGFITRSYPASKQWMQVVVQKFDIEKGNHTEVVVVNRRRSLQYDIQVSDWDKGKKQLQKCLRRFAKSKSLPGLRLPVTYGIVAIGGYAKFYEYHLEDDSMTPLFPDNPALHIGLKCSTIQSFLNRIKADN